MHTLLIITHIIAMSLSIGMMTIAVELGLIGKNVAAKIATGGFFASVVGFITGIGLLFGSPLSVECALLTAYLLAATLLYRYGFALGDARRARLIRQLR